MLVRSRIKPYLILGSTIVVIAGAAYFWGLRSSLLSLEKEAQANIQKAKDFDSLKTRLSKQKNECLAYLAQEEGNFEQFSFCRKFKDWTDSLGMGNL